MPTRFQETIDVGRPVDALVTLESYNSIKASARIIGVRKLFVKTLQEGCCPNFVLIPQLFARVWVQELTGRRQNEFLAEAAPDPTSAGMTLCPRKERS